MATGMQTGRRTGVSALRTGTAKKPAGGGGLLGGVKKWWNGLESKYKTIVIVSVALLVIVAISANVMVAANRPVKLFAGTITSSDASEIQRKLIEWGIPCTVEPGGTNVLVHPKYKERALVQLAQAGLPRRPVQGTLDLLAKKEGGMVPDTKEDKERKMVLALEGDLTNTIRQIEGVSDAYVKIVPKPDDAWGEDKTSASAAIMLKLTPGTQLSNQQINGIVHLVTSSVAGLKPEKVKIVDTTGKVLNNRLAKRGAMAMGDEEGYTPEYILHRRAIEKDFREKVQHALNKFLGKDRYDVQVSVEMDFSQKERKVTKYGGVANTQGYVDAGVQKQTEKYDGGSSAADANSGAQQLSGSTGTKNDYTNEKVTIRRLVDKKEMREVNTTPKIKRITCSVMVDGVKDPKMLERIEKFTKNAIGFDPTRGDEIAVVNYPITNKALLENMEQASPALGSFPGRSGGRNAQMPGWLPVVLGVPLVLIIMFIALFYMKQKNVQKEKERLVLTSGPGTTVSDISDLLADKEGKVTTPPATRVNTNDQLENFAKEKPTKVAELLKSTWLADR